MSLTNKQNFKYHLAAASVDFGWGGSGALANILRYYQNVWDDTEVSIVGSDLGVQLIQKSINCKQYNSLEHLIQYRGIPDVALSVLESDFIRVASNLGLSTVFVDLLPFLWGEEQLEWVPKNVNYYLAQAVAGLEEFSQVVPKEAIRVSPIVSHQNFSNFTCKNKIIKYDCTVVLGGLLSPQQTDREGYVRAIVPSILVALKQIGSYNVRVVGNLSEYALENIRLLGERLNLCVLCGFVEPHKFTELLLQSALIAAQPGLMTLLEASYTGNPFIRLPPQNVAGFIQSEAFDSVAASGSIVNWPRDVLAIEQVKKLREKGESIANQYCYNMLNNYTDTISWSDTPFLSNFLNAIKETSKTPLEKRRAFFLQSGVDGARQVAHKVREVTIGKHLVSS